MLPDVIAPEAFFAAFYWVGLCRAVDAVLRGKLPVVF